MQKHQHSLQLILKECPHKVTQRSPLHQPFNNVKEIYRDNSLGVSKFGFKEVLKEVKVHF